MRIRWFVARLAMFMVLVSVPSAALAQDARDGTEAQLGSVRPFTVVDDEHTAREEAEGQEIWTAFRTGSRACASFSDAEYAALGEFFMGQMVGSAHAAMNVMMVRMMGEDGEEAMHVIMGKRMSGCDPNAAYPASSIGFMPMMGIMMGGGTMGGWTGSWSGQSWNPRMMFTGSWGWFGWIGMILWWALVILAVIALIRWVAGQSGTARGKSAREILEERYARGEITKAELDEKRRDLGIRS